jgi:hypothetical protein
MQDEQMEPSKSPDRSTAGRIGSWIVRAIGLWIVAGALFKLLLGTPADLPKVVRDLPLELGLIYKLVISAELCIGTLAMLRPRWGWPLVAAQLAVFVVVLVQLILAGAESCGCFGSEIIIPPEWMLAVDGVLLVAMLLGRPWGAGAAGGPSLRWIAALCVVAIAATWMLDRELAAVPDPEGEETVAEADSGLRSWVELDVENWAGKDLEATPLSNWLDVYQYPPTGLYVFWRQTCDHCAEHLEQLADTELGQRMLTLIQLEEAHDSEANNLVYRMPEGDFVIHAALPDTIDYIVETPAEMEVEDWVVVSGAQGLELEEHY